MHPIFCTTLLAALLWAPALHAQNRTTLPPTGRIVYKCWVDKKAVYSDDPCLGAQRIDIEPTRGFSKSTGRESVGADVARENFRDQKAQIWNPLVNLTPNQWAVLERRHRLPPEDILECGRLEAAIVQLEAAERVEPAAGRPAVQQQLHLLRKRDRALRC